MYRPWSGKGLWLRQCHSPWVERDIEFFPDQLPQPRRRPKFRLEAVVQRALGQPAEGDLLLDAGQLGRAARHGPGEESRSTAFTMRGDPTTDRPRSDTKEVGDLYDGRAIQDALDGKQATTLVLLG